MKKILYFLQWVWATGFNMVFRILPAYLATFISSAFQISLVTASYNLAKAMALPCGYVVDRVGKARMVFVAFIGSAVLALALSLTSQIPHLIILFFLSGIAANFYYNSINSIISTHKRKTEGLFRLETVYQLGFFIGPLAGGFIASQYSMLLAFYAWALLSIIGFIASSLFLRKEFARDGSKPGKVSDLFKKIRRRMAIHLAVGGFITGFLFAVNGLVIPLYAVSLGMTIWEVGLILAFAALISAVGFYLLSSRMERIGLEKALFVMMALSGIPYLFMDFAREIVLLTVLTGVFFIGRAGGLNIARSYISHNTDESVRATGLSLVDTVHFAGGFAGPLFAGLVMDFVGVQAVFISVFAISLAGMALTLCCRFMK